MTANEKCILVEEYGNEALYKSHVSSVQSQRRSVKTSRNNVAMRIKAIMVTKHLVHKRMSTVM